MKSDLTFIKASPLYRAVFEIQINFQKYPIAGNTYRSRYEKHAFLNLRTYVILNIGSSYSVMGLFLGKVFLNPRIF